jgi:hypothetical protein
VGTYLTILEQFMANFSVNIIILLATGLLAIATTSLGKQVTNLKKYKRMYVDKVMR